MQINNPDYFQPVNEYLEGAITAEQFTNETESLGETRRNSNRFLLLMKIMELATKLA